MADDNAAAAAAATTYTAFYDSVQVAGPTPDLAEAVWWLDKEHRRDPRRVVIYQTHPLLTCPMTVDPLRYLHFGWVQVAPKRFSFWGRAPSKPVWRWKGVMRRVCSVCGLVFGYQFLVSPDDPAAGQDSHGYCDACYLVEKRKLDQAFPEI